MEFDHHSEEFARRQHEIYADLRRRCPVARTSSHGGYVVLTRYADVSDAARQWQDFSSENDPEGCGAGGVAIPRVEVVQQLPAELDPPRHTQVRAFLAPFFTRQAVDRCRPSLESRVSACLAELEGDTEVDLVDRFARRVPAETILEIIGLDPNRWQRYSQPIARVVSSPPEAIDLDALFDLQAIAADLAEELELQRAGGDDDLLGHLVTLSEAGADIDEEDIVCMCTLLLFAGVENVCATVAHALSWLDTNRSTVQRLRTKPDVMPHFREELLRYFSPAQALARTATRGVTLADTWIHGGERVLLSWAAANRDPSVFERPDEVMLDRAVARHLAFGIGTHFCLGVHLARLEIDVMLRAVVDDYPDFTINHQGARRFASVGIVNGFDHLYGSLGQRSIQCWAA